jgi:hypothetical protein
MFLDWRPILACWCVENGALKVKGLLTRKLSKGYYKVCRVALKSVRKVAQGEVKVKQRQYLSE